MKTPFDPIPAVISDIRKGRMVIVTDDADRENEGDLVMAASKVTANAVNFMAKFGRGLICAPITEERASQLGLQRMVDRQQLRSRVQAPERLEQLATDESGRAGHDDPDGRQRGVPGRARGDSGFRHGNQRVIADRAWTFSGSS